MKQIIMRPAQIINHIITKVTFPIMAKIQHDTQRLKNIYLKTINYLSSPLFFYVPVGIYVGSHWGLEGIGWGLIWLQVSLVIPNWYFLVKPLCGAGFVEYNKEIIVPAIVALGAGVISYLLMIYVEQAILKFLIGSFVGFVVVVGLNYLMNKEFLMELRGFRG